MNDFSQSIVQPDTCQLYEQRVTVFVDEVGLINISHRIDGEYERVIVVKPDVAIEIAIAIMHAVPTAVDTYKHT